MTKLLRHAALAGGLATMVLLLGGCVGAVPLPGIKTGRAVDESTAKQIAPGATYAEVILRYGEPDSVSVDGRTIAYRYSRIWGAAWAVGQNGDGGAMAFDYGEALVVTFDEQNRVVRAERKKAGWFKDRAEDGTLLYAGPGNSDFHCEPVEQSWSGWWREGELGGGEVPMDVGTCERLAARADENLSSTARVPGRVFLTTAGLRFRPEFATGTALASERSLQFAQARLIVQLNGGSPFASMLLVLEDGRVCSCRLPGTEDPSNTGDASVKIVARSTTNPAAGVAVEGWSLVNANWMRSLWTMSWPKDDAGWMWIRPEGLQFELRHRNKPTVSRLVRWVDIREVEMARVLGIPGYVQLRLGPEEVVLIKCSRTCPAMYDWMHALQIDLDARWRRATGRPPAEVPPAPAG